MHITKTLSTIVIVLSTCLAQNFNISGIVTDTGGTAIERAAVILEKRGIKDTTGADGSFMLIGITGINEKMVLTHNVFGKKTDKNPVLDRAILNCTRRKAHPTR